MSCLVLCFTKGLTALQGNELRKSEPDAAETAAQEAAVPAAQLASWKTVAHMDWREQVEEQASAGDVATTSQPATAATENVAVIPAPVTPAVEHMLQVMHSTIPAPVTPAVEHTLQVIHSTIPAPVTPAVERMLQVMHPSILGATSVHCACWSSKCISNDGHLCPQLCSDATLLELCVLTTCVQNEIL